MYFEESGLYHVFNRGNNSERVFFSDKNYLYFLEKLKYYVYPYADIIAYCLMPNHFHLMIYVNFVRLEVKTIVDGSNHRILGVNTDSFAQTENNSTKKGDTLLRKPESQGQCLKFRTINDSIGIMLRSYTSAIQKQENRRGSLFQKETQSIQLNGNDKLSPAYFNNSFYTQINIPIPEKEYPQVCFNYIHLNPVNAHLTKEEKGWSYSSYREYAGIAKEKLINRERSIELGLKW